MALNVSKTGVISVKATDSQKRSAALSRVMATVARDGVANINATLRDVSRLAKFVTDGGNLPAGFIGDIADPMARLAFVLETRTDNAVSAIVANPEK